MFADAAATEWLVACFKLADMQRDELQHNSPLLTVAIPTYRGAAYIGAAIASVLEQTFVDFELLIIDDQSPDDTRSVVARFSDARIRYLQNPKNLGPEGNWNRCLALARGKYFKLLPHDDTLNPNCLARQVAVLEADDAHRIALVFGAREVMGPDGKVLTRRSYPGALEGALAAADVMRACVRRGTNLVGEPGAVTFRKSLADQIGPFDATNPYVIDLDYWFRLLAHGNAYYCDEIMAGFRLSKGSWSVAIGTGQTSDFHGFTSRVLARQSLFLTTFDRICGRFTPALNNLARLVFYRLYVK